MFYSGYEFGRLCSKNKNCFYLMFVLDHSAQTLIVQWRNMDGTILFFDYCSGTLHLLFSYFRCNKCNIFSLFFLFWRCLLSWWYRTENECYGFNRMYSFILCSVFINKSTLNKLCQTHRLHVKFKNYFKWGQWRQYNPKIHN